MKTNHLTTEKVSKLFFHYLVPSILGTMVTSIYILADTIIIGKGIGTDAMAALNIILPIFSIFFGFGLWYGVGGSVLMSIARGRGDKALGDTYFSVALILNAITCIVCTLVFWFFMEPIMYFLGATDVTMPYIKNYAPYVILGLSCFAFSTFLQTFVRNDGAPRHSMIAVITGGVLNIILDIVFVYPLDMGMAGASIASVIGAACTTVILLFHFFSKTNGLRFTLRKVNFKISLEIYKNGFTSFLIEMCSGIMMFAFNLQLLKYVGEAGVSMYGVIANTLIIVTCLCNGINQAAQPIISTNHGAGLTKRIHSVKRLGIYTSVIVCAVPTILGLLWPNMFTYIFLNPNKEILALSPSAIRIYFLSFILMGVNMFVVGYFQSTLKPQYSLLLCLLRGCVLSVIFVYILPPIFGVNGIWSSVVLAELLTLCLAIIFLQKSGKGTDK